jgi:SAM-dependent methyltransferase
MTVESYFIKAGYTPNDKAETLDKVSGEQYWNKSSIYSSYYYQFPVYRYSEKLIREKNIQRVIDVGCGTGTKLAFIHKDLPEVNITGIDQKAAIEYCKNHYSFGNWYVDDIESPDESLGDIKAELVICSDVIEHLLNPDVLLVYLKKKVSRDGYIILSTPERDIFRGENCMSSPNKFHVREWNFEEFENYLLFSDFRIIEHFLQYPIRFGVNRIFLNTILKRLITGRGLKYNQVCLLQVK